MSLVTLNTNFKSLKPGKDRKGGGSSNQPYITKPIPDQNKTPNTPDSIIRGGLIAPKRALEDSKRLSKMFIDTKTPIGLLFTSKMNILSRTSVKTEATQGLGYGGGNINQGVYTPLSTITQAATGFIGNHFDTFGILGVGEIQRYGDVIRAKVSYDKGKEDISAKTNRLLTLHNEHNLKSKNNDGILLDYPGGPGSFKGQGKTIIKKGKHLTTEKGNKDSFIREYGGEENIVKKSKVTTLNSKQIYERAKGNKNKSTKIQSDFRNEIEYFRGPNNVSSSSEVYEGKNASERTYHGDPGRYNKEDGSKDVFSYDLAAYKMLAVDKINALPHYESNNADDNKAINDLVKFRIVSLSNDNPNENVYMHFRAFIDSFTDNYAANHSPINYVGRGDSFYSYRGFERTINLSFTVAAQSKAELIPMYRKLNYLASSVMPDYTSNGFMRGNLTRLTLGGYLFEQPGIITSLSYDIPQESPWEIAIDRKGEGDPSVKELPHIIRVSNFSFTPIHNFLAQKPSTVKSTSKEYVKERFIALTNSTGTNSTKGAGNYIDEEPYKSYKKKS